MYYLSNTASRGIRNKDSTTARVDSKTENELKANVMITLLNGNNNGTETIWYKDTGNKNNGYPIFSYQNN